MHVLCCTTVYQPYSSHYRKCAPKSNYPTIGGGVSCGCADFPCYSIGAFIKCASKTLFWHRNVHHRRRMCTKMCTKLVNVHQHFHHRADMASPSRKWHHQTKNGITKPKKASPASKCPPPSRVPSKIQKINK